jgi:hypothetical protein
MSKLKFNVVCTNIDHTEAGAYIASFVPADEKTKDKLKDGFRVAVGSEDFEEGEEPEAFEEAFKVGELYEMTIDEPKAVEEKSDEEKAKTAEAKAKKAEADKAYKAKKKAEEAEAINQATKNA